MANFFSNTWNSIKSAASKAKSNASAWGSMIFGGGNKQTTTNTPSIYDGTQFGPEQPFDMGAFSALINGANGGGATAKTIPAYTNPLNYNADQAKANAEAAYNPYYDKQNALNAEKFASEKKYAQQDYSIGTQLETTALDKFLEQSGLLGTRSKEDLTSALTSLEAQRGEARAETSYGRVRQLRSLVDELSTSGLAFGGMASRAGKEAAQGRTLAKDKMERTYTESVSGANTAATRTGEDLALQEEARRAENKAKLDQLLQNKNRSLEDIKYREKVLKVQQDQERKDKIAAATASAFSNAYMQWEVGLNQHKAKYGY